MFAAQAAFAGRPEERADGLALAHAFRREVDAADATPGAGGELAGAVGVRSTIGAMSSNESPNAS
jgi:hypothetical protein